jgi:hypothetical protein
LTPPDAGAAAVVEHVTVVRAKILSLLSGVSQFTLCF